MLTTGDPPIIAAQSWDWRAMPSYFYGAGSSKAGSLMCQTSALPPPYFPRPQVYSVIPQYFVHLFLDYLIYHKALGAYARVTAELLRLGD